MLLPPLSHGAFVKPIVLLSPSGCHWGFVLCAVPPGETEGDCIFSIVPDKPEDFEDPLLEQLLLRKEMGESSLEVAPDRQSIVIRTEGLEDLFAQWDNTGHGQWGIWREGEEQTIGPAKLTTATEV